ncbi:MAG: dienelactone hydrolase family protein [Verrucomicrobiota bacterium]
MQPTRSHRVAPFPPCLIPTRRFGVRASAGQLFRAVTLACLVFSIATRGEEPGWLSQLPPLVVEGDLSAQMVEGIDRFLMRETDHAVAERAGFWRRDVTSAAQYAKSIEANRERFRKAIGAVDPRLPGTALEYVSTTDLPALAAETTNLTIHVVRWRVFDDVTAEGLLLTPKDRIQARIVALPDADQTPEMLAGLAPGIQPESQFARRLAEQGCQVLVPVLIDRQDTWSGSEELGRFTNQPHREWVYRQAFELGRHVIGYEVQKVLAAVDWFAERNGRLDAQARPRIGVAGYGEGGLIAFYSAALDSRIEAALVSGYFGPRQRLWEEPIYRNVFRLLAEFGDAEVASMIAPRALVVEHSEWPKVDGPPAPRAGRNGAAPGRLVTPDRMAVEAEVEPGQGFLPRHLWLQSGIDLCQRGTDDCPGLNRGSGRAAGGPAG